MKKIPVVFLFLSVGLLANAASGNVILGNLSITITNPADDLSNIWFIFAQSDVPISASPVTGTAAAGTSTVLNLPSFSYDPTLGTAGFAVAATYGGLSGAYVALAPATASALIASSASFNAAFPKFTAGNTCGEGDLINALAGQSACLEGLGAPPGTTLSFFAQYAFNAGQLAVFTGSGDSSPTRVPVGPCR
jgi:hypothetical protein